MLARLGEISNTMGNYDLARSYLLDSLVIRVEAFGHVGDPSEAAAAASAAASRAEEEQKRAANNAPGGGGSKKERLEREEKAKAEEEERKRNHKCYHPELADTLLGIADNLRCRGMYGPWDGPALSQTTTAHIEDNKDKEEEFLRKTSHIGSRSEEQSRSPCVDAGCLCYESGQCYEH